VMTIYNPFAFDLTFTISATQPTCYTVKPSRGQIKLRSQIQIVIIAHSPHTHSRWTQPTNAFLATGAMTTPSKTDVKRISQSSHSVSESGWYDKFMVEVFNGSLSIYGRHIVPVISVPPTQVKQVPTESPALVLTESSALVRRTRPSRSVRIAHRLATTILVLAKMVVRMCPVVIGLFLITFLSCFSSWTQHSQDPSLAMPLSPSSSSCVWLTSYLSLLSSSTFTSSTWTNQAIEELVAGLEMIEQSTILYLSFFVGLATMLVQIKVLYMF